MNLVDHAVLTFACRISATHVATIGIHNFKQVPIESGRYFMLCPDDFSG
jgi:hypothetical protein